MLGLDDYGSSDDDHVQTSNPAPPPPPPAKPETTSEPQPAPAEPNEEPPQPAPAAPASPPAAPKPAAKDEQDEQEEPAPGPALPPVAEDAPIAGPAAGPASGPSAPPTAEEPSDDATSAPLSPYSANRALMRTLTMPRAPNFDIPPSPPGSPPREASKKFSHFLKLKEQGQHFNKRLEDSAALRNPSLLQKLLGFAGVTDEAQYASTLPDDVVAVPTSFPPSAYADQLAKTQQEITRKKEEEQRKTQREAVEFVSEGAPRAAGGVSMAERVRAGLSRDSSASSSGTDGRARDGERRGEKRKSRFDERERSPRRR